MSSKSADEADRLDRLAARLDELQAENGRLREQIESEPETESSDEPAVTTTRRGALGTLAALAGVGVLSDRATAQSAAPGSACTWRGDQNAAGYNLLGLGAVGGDLTSGNTVSNLAGTDLAIDSDGNLNVDPGAGGEAGLWTEEQDGDVTTSGGQGVDVPSVQTDNINTTEYVADFSELASRISSVGGGTRYVVEAGTHSISSSDAPIDMTGLQDVIIEGQGFNATAFDATGIGSRIFEVDGVSSGNRQERFHFRDFAITGDNTAGSVGIYLGRVKNADIDNIRIDSIEIGVEIEGGSFQNTVTRSEFTDCGLRSLHAHQGGGSSGPNVLTVDTVVSIRAGSEGFLFENFSGLTANIQSEDSGLENVYVAGVDGVDLTGHVEAGSSGPDRDSDGNDNPVGITLTPGTGNECSGVNIHGMYIGVNSPASGDGGFGIVAGDVDGLHVSGCNFRSGGSNSTAFEIGEAATNVTFDASNAYDDSLGTGIDGPIDGSNIQPERLNDGVFSTAVFMDFNELAVFCSNHLGTNASNAVDVRIANDISSSSNTIDGSAFPQQTIFSGRGATGVTVTSSGGGAGDYAVLLEREGQRVEDLAVAQTGGAAAAVNLGAAECVARGVRVTDSPGEGIRSRGDRTFITGCVVESAAVSSDDIDINRDGERVIGNDAAVNVGTNATNEAVAGNTDTA